MSVETLNMANPANVELAKWIPVVPAISMAVCALLGIFKQYQRLAGLVTSLAVMLCFIFSCFVYSGMDMAAVAKDGGYTVHFFEWINSGGFKGNFSYFIDGLTIVMMLVVTGIGTLIAIYAAGYMKGDPGYFRFFAYFSFFIFAMTNLVMADNLLLLYLGWEGVGLASFLLIGFYYRKPSAVAAAKKAFIVNRVGDFGFALGLMLLFTVFGSIEYKTLLAKASGTDMATQVGFDQWALLLIPFLLMLGAFGKSAQLPLHVWLPDAMEGPTPVSALVHAATMVTAGVYMIARLMPVFQLNPVALTTVAWVGAITAIFAATIALCQYDIKRIWAYSTVSQLGYMFLGVGVLGTTGAVFHLYTHAFFKALLFLTAGSVMHALAGQLDLRKMGGLLRKMPVTGWLMFAGCIALAGVPLTAGFFSKDTILTDAWVSSPTLGLIGVLTALLTAFYTFRLWFRVFLGETKYEMGNEHHGYPVEEHHDAHGHDHGHAAGHSAGHGADHAHSPHEMPWAMNGPLLLLAVGALAAGYFGVEWMQSMIQASTAGQIRPELLHADKAHHDHIHHIMMYVSGGGALVAIGMAWLFHYKHKGATESIARSMAPVVHVLHNKYFIDELYHRAIVLPLRFTGHLMAVLDRYIVDGLVWLVQSVPPLAGAIQRVAQRGLLQGYGLAMALGIVAILTFVLMRG